MIRALRLAQRWQSSIPASPGPLPLADKQQQRAIEKLIEEKQKPIERGMAPHPDSEREPLQPHPDSKNPRTGERGGPKGPEPTRYGDWERKGRVYGTVHAFARRVLSNQ